MFRILLGSLVIIPIVLSYQNCSTEMNFTPTAEFFESNACDEFGNCVRKQYTEMVAGVDLPPLKMFVIVDNSYTMEANQVNLGASFEKMFSDVNKDSLNSFDTTAYILNTAQFTYRYGQPNLGLLQSTVKPLSHFSAMNLNDFSSTQRPNGNLGFLTGEVPGDVVGYQTEFLNDEWTFSPAPVIGVATSFNGSALSTSIRKPANVDVTAFSDEFKRRLALLSPQINPDNRPNQPRFFQETQDFESGMCSMARILGNSNLYLRPGDQSVFLFVTDEDEADPIGDNCIRSILKTDKDVQDVYCENRSTVVEYKGEECTGSSFTGMNVDYTFPDPGSSSIRLSDVANYKTTNVRYRLRSYNEYDYTITFKKRIFESRFTKVRYCEKKSRDGLVLDQCSNIFNEINVQGDHTSASACAAAAASSSGGSSVSATVLAPTCTLLGFSDLPDTATCVVGPNCRAKYIANAGSFVTSKRYTLNQAQANQELVNYIQQNSLQPRTAFIDGADSTSYPSFVVKQTYSVEALCPPGAADCVQTETALKTVNGRRGVFANGTQACVDEAIAAAGSKGSLVVSGSVTCAAGSDQLDAAGRGTCPENSTTQTCTPNGVIELAGNCTTQFPNRRCLAFRKVSLPIDFNQRPTQFLSDVTANAQCSAELRTYINSIQTNFNAQNTTESTCRISFPTTKRLSFHALPALAGSSACTAEIMKTCTTSAGAQRVCAATHASTTVYKTASIPEELNCQATCQDSVTGYCTGKVGATPTTLIVNVDNPRVYNRSNCQAKVTKTDLTQKYTVTLDQVPGLCKAASANVPQIYVDQDSGRTGLPYKLANPKVTHVAGSTSVNGVDQPSTNLKNYIVTKASEVLDPNFPPIVSAFVRLQADGNGQGGSIGTNYIDLTQSLNGQSTSVLSNDYGPALSELSAIIQARVQRGFVLAQLTGQQQIRKLWLRNLSDTNWIEVLETDYTINGNSVRISEQIQLERGRKVRIEYW